MTQIVTKNGAVVATVDNGYNLLVIVRYVLRHNFQTLLSVPSGRGAGHQEARDQLLSEAQARISREAAVIIESLGGTAS
jgi:hypothetical protein